MKTQTKLNRSELDLFWKKEIVSWIDLEAYEIAEPQTIKEKLTILENVFKEETGLTILHQEDIKGHLMGLPSICSPIFENYKIIELLKECGTITERTTEKQVDKLLENYWDYVSAKLLQLFRAPSTSIIFKRLEA
mgnify:CR=1 FL=1